MAQPLPIAALPRANAFFGNKRAGCLSTAKRASSCPRRKKRLREGSRRPSCTGMFLLVLFFAPKKSTRKKTGF